MIPSDGNLASVDDAVACPPPLKQVIARHQISARRGMGQNFLMDTRLATRIARAAGPLTANVIEIGAGPGGLTRALLEQGANRVIAVERDPRCIAALSELTETAVGRLEVVPADALALDLADLVSAPRVIVANLPYNIATPLLIRWLRQANAYEKLTLMFQKEVAERIVAEPRTKARGRLSILAQWRTRPKRLFDVPPRAFVPAPKVTSTLVQFSPRPTPLAQAPATALEQVTAAAFGQRRKMLRASLRALGTDPGPLLAAASIPGTWRAEELDVAGFCGLARAFAAANLTDSSHSGV